jgi:tRNA1Val (adenine37-N6)-methyltransferase
LANPYFKFKQFTIFQDHSTMKVSTDSCIFGAWFAAKMPEYATALDIGSGTGLLMLMLAQKSHGEIHGIELDLGSYKQSKSNISQSIWEDRLKVFPGDARTYSFPGKYDFIITNPPFYENDLLPESERDQIAKHSKMLVLEDLVRTIDEHLSPGGSFGILLPYHRWEYFDSLTTKHRLFLTEKLFVRQTEDHQPFRAILHYGRSKENFIPSFELIIKDSDGAYTQECKELLKDYYLHL